MIGEKIMRSCKLEEATMRALQGKLKTTNKKVERKANLNEGKVIWSSDFDMDDIDTDFYRDEVYQDYLDNFDSSETPMSYEEWLDSDYCGSLFDGEWEDVYQQTGEYADWSDFILNYISDEEKEYYYNEYVENCKTITRQPDDFEAWLDNNYERISEDYWELAKEDLEDNIFPNIDSQINNDVLLLLGYYGSNYPDFKKSGQGGKLFSGIDDFQDYMGNFDGVNITSDNGILGATLYDHDGTVSGDFYTLPKDYMKVIKALGYEDIVKEEYDEEDLDKYNIEDLMEDTFNEDLRYGNLEAQDFEEVRELLVPIKDNITMTESKEIKTESKSKEDIMNKITEKTRYAFDVLNDILYDGNDLQEVDGWYYPSRAIEIIEDVDKRYHLNPHMDLTMTDIFNMVGSNETIEEAIDELYDDFKEEDAYSWAENFLSILEKVDINCTPARYYEIVMNDREKENVWVGISHDDYIFTGGDRNAIIDCAIEQGKMKEEDRDNVFYVVGRSEKEYNANKGV